MLPITVVTSLGCGRVGFDAQADAVDAPLADATVTNLLTNASFETSENWPAGWLFQVIAPAAATLTRDTTTKARDGVASAWANVTALDGVDWHVQLKQQGIPVTAGTTYAFTLWARADRPLRTYLTAQQDHDPYNVFGASDVDLTTSWQMFSVTFSPPADDTLLVSILLGVGTGDFWVDDARLTVP